MNIKKLCEEFHEKIGKDKTVKITIEEGDTEDMTGWVTGQMRPEIWVEMKGRLKNHKHDPTSFMKLSKGAGIEYVYRADKITQERKKATLEIFQALKIFPVGLCAQGENQ